MEQDETYATMVAVHQEWVILAVENESQDGFHRLDWNLLLLRTLHIEDVVLDAVLVDESSVSLGEFFLYKRTEVSR